MILDAALNHALNVGIVRFPLSAAVLSSLLQPLRPSLRCLSSAALSFAVVDAHSRWIAGSPLLVPGATLLTAAGMAISFAYWELGLSIVTLVLVSYLRSPATPLYRSVAPAIEGEADAPPVSTNAARPD
jgi:hypothetical protein